MDERKTARVLLLGPDKRILLVKFHDESIFKPDAPGPSVFWATVGGKLEPGEDVMAAATREAREETGHTIRLGPKVWYGEQVLHWNGALTLFMETFIVAFLDNSEVSKTGWSDIEKDVIKEMRWWTLDDLVRTDETVYPAVMQACFLRSSRATTRPACCESIFRMSREKKGGRCGPATLKA